MRTYLIRVNDLPYLGEDPEKTYEDGFVWNGSFHTKPSQLNVLKFGPKGEFPKRIYGTRGLKSEMERIIRRIDDGLMDWASDISILVTEGEA